MPIQFVVTEGLVLTGEVLDISASGIKLKILFQNEEEKVKIEENLIDKDMTLALGDDDDGTPIKVLVRAKWNVYRSSEGEKVYEVGLYLNLDDDQRQKWEEFYNKLPE